MVALVAMAVRWNRWQIGAAGPCSSRPARRRWQSGEIPGAYGYHYVLVVAFLEVVAVVLVAVVVRLNKELVVTRRHDDA